MLNEVVTAAGWPEGSVCPSAAMVPQNFPEVPDTLDKFPARDAKSSLHVGAKIPCTRIGYSWISNDLPDSSEKISLPAGKSGVSRQ